MDSPFSTLQVIEDLLVPSPVESTEINISAIENLADEALEIKREVDSLTKRYNAKRGAIAELMKSAGIDKAESETFIASLTTTSSGYEYSEETTALAEKVKLLQTAEKKRGIAKPSSTTVSVTLKAR